jgi:uncharacterized protein (DUF427 family)
MRMLDAMNELRQQLRYEPTEKRVRAMLGRETVVDTTRAVLVWEPRRLVPTYAVPVDELRAELQPADTAPDTGVSVLHPGIPFAVHSAEGRAVTVSAGGETREAAGFLPADPGLSGHVVLDFAAFDAWHEEDEPITGHPRDPFHRIDVRASSRHVRVELGGEVLADSTRARLLFETSLPVRFYFPRDDVAPMQRSTHRTHCPYKGDARYWSPEAGGRVRENLGWTYEQPLPDAVAIAGLVAFYDEVVDVFVDGERHSRPSGPIAASLAAEFGVDGD